MKIFVKRVFYVIGFLVISFKGNSQCTVPTSERDALIALYNATDGPNWTNNTNWNTAADVCDWYGVTVTSGSITTISLTNNNLTGIIPTELGTLSGLEALHFDENQLSGVIFSALGNLTNLNDLRLNNNQFSGAIPSQLGNLLNLVHLKLSNNLLTGNIPNSLGSLVNLKYFWLNGNQLSGSIPLVFGDLINLDQLWLHGNQLTGAIPTELGGLVNVRHFLLADNQLSGSIPTQLGNLTKATKLWLGSNQLTGIIPSQLGNLSSLTELWLDTNQLTGSIPIELGNLTNLEELRLYNLQLSGSIPIELGDLVNLRELYLFNNQLSGNIPAEFGNLTNLEQLWLFNNQLSGSIPNLGNIGSFSNFYFESNAFVFSDFETEHNTYLSSLEQYRYSPQAKVDQPETIVIEAGNSYTLTTSLTSLNNSYQWYKEGALIPGATNKEHIISNASIGDAGAYHVIATNSIITGLTLERETISMAWTPCPVSTTEHDALMAMYNATDGPNWTNNTNWGTTADVCDWYGVTVNLGRVTEINLYNNNLTGILPADLQDLQELTKLDVSKNQLSGTIPSSLTTITTLTDFYFEHNAYIFYDFENEHSTYNSNLTKYFYSPQAKVDQVEIPTIGYGSNYTLTTSLSSTNNSYQWYKDDVAITGATNKNYTITNAATADAGVYKVVATNNIVTGLTLERQSITITVTPCMVPDSERDALIELYNATDGPNWSNTLANNQPWDINIPVCDWYGVTVTNNTVTGIEMIGNQLSGGIPNSISNLSNLTFLRLVDNQLLGSIPSSIGSLTQLTFLHLHRNQFSGSIPQELTALPSLGEVIIHTNQLSGDIPFFSNLNYRLKFSNNSFVFSDFEDEHNIYSGAVTDYSYIPQAKVDQEETVFLAPGNSYTLSSNSLSSSNNTYQWYKDGTLIAGATSKDLVITSATEADQGEYHFLASNTVVGGLTLERNTITLLIGDENTFCSSELDDFPQVGNLTPGGSNIVWYADEIGGLPLDSTEELIEETEDLTGAVYWWDDITDNTATRTPVTVFVNQDSPSDDNGEDYQFMDVGATIGDLVITGTNIQWFDTALSTVPLASTDLLIHEGIYYAEDVGVSACRLTVEVYLGPLPPEGDSVQYVCPGSALYDLFVEKNYDETIIWYDAPTGGNILPDNTPLVNDAVYYASKVDNASNESIERTAVTAFFTIVALPSIPSAIQSFYSDQQATVQDLQAYGFNIVWYDSETGGNEIGPGTLLVHDQIYYAEQTATDQLMDGVCMSARVAVKVNILQETTPTIIGCEKFKPQLGDRYIISGWVREQGVTAVNTVTKNFNNSEESILFVELLNHLKTRFLSADPEIQEFPEAYVPESNVDNIDFDPLIPFLVGIQLSEKKLTVYDFTRIEDNLGRSIGFSFFLNNSRTHRFEYITPEIQLDLCDTCFIQETTTINYPLLFKGPEILNFTNAQVNAGVLSVNQVFDAVNPNLQDNGNTSVTSYAGTSETVQSGILESADFSDYDEDLNYQQMDYMNAKVELVYTDKNGNAMTTETLVFEPQGQIIDGWQRVVGDFVIPELETDVALLTINLVNNNNDVNAYFDDIRMHPFNSNMKTFVYHPVTQRLMSELDENNYSTFYEYDAEGGLIRVKKETEKGIYTIQETRSGNIKNNGN